MELSKVEVICGFGLGKTSLALGKGIAALTDRKKVIVIQFLKGNAKNDGIELLKGLEPEFKVFRFEKSDSCFGELSRQEKQEELINIRNGFNFAKKVVATGECDLLILDEILGLMDHNIIEVEEFERLLEAREESMGLILTGQVFPEALRPYVDVISTIEHINVDKNHKEC